MLSESPEDRRPLLPVGVAAYGHAIDRARIVQKGVNVQDGEGRTALNQARS